MPDWTTDQLPPTIPTREIRYSGTPAKTAGVEQFEQPALAGIAQRSQSEETPPPEISA